MRPHHLNSPLQYTGLRTVFPAGLVAPALHRLAVLGNQKTSPQRPPFVSSRLPLRDLLCYQAKKGLPDFTPLHAAQSWTECGPSGKRESPLYCPSVLLHVPSQQLCLQDGESFCVSK